jgi:3-hydroxyisobutyrate dehydrogenase
MTKDLVLYVDHLRELGVPCLNASGPLAAFGAAANLGYADQISNRVVDAIGDLAGGVRLHPGGAGGQGGCGAGAPHAGGPSPREQQGGER